MGKSIEISYFIYIQDLLHFFTINYAEQDDVSNFVMFD